LNCAKIAELDSPDVRLNAQIVKVKIAQTRKKMAAAAKARWAKVAKRES
jgi:hypothetical protein